MGLTFGKHDPDQNHERLLAAAKLIDDGDFDGGMFQLRRLQDEGQRDSMIVLARMYEAGIFGVKRDITKALKIYHKLVEDKDPLAFLRLGQLYALGENIPQDYDMAFYYYSILANAGDARAQFVIGDMYQRGLHTERNLDTARLWFKSAAEKGHLYSAKNVAVIDCLSGQWLSGPSRLLYWNIAILGARIFRPNSMKLARI
ncbi:MAG: tetratricopeptide repeat protein [Woeseiaceae bacterium]